MSGGMPGFDGVWTSQLRCGYWDRNCGVILEHAEELQMLSDFVMFGGERVHVTEAVCILQCSGMTEPKIFEWLERKYRIGRFA